MRCVNPGTVKKFNNINTVSSDEVGICVGEASLCQLDDALEAFCLDKLPSCGEMAGHSRQT